MVFFMCLGCPQKLYIMLKCSGLILPEKSAINLEKISKSEETQS